MSPGLFKSMLMKSAHIQRAIEREQQRRRPDWLRLLRLKKISLVLKDRIMRLVRQSWRGRARTPQLRLLQKI